MRLTQTQNMTTDQEQDLCIQLRIVPQSGHHGKHKVLPLLITLLECLLEKAFRDYDLLKKFVHFLYSQVGLLTKNFVICYIELVLRREVYSR